MGMVTGSGNTAIHQLFSYDSSGNVVSVDYSSNGGSTFTTYYYLRNAQNDVVKLIDGSGNTVVQYTYDSWGKLLSTTGSLASTLGANQPFRYRGYVYDAETGWYYLQSRYYDPSICRFISADVLLSTGQGVIGHNSYAYCGNNPICRTDPSGCSWEDVCNWLKGAAQDVEEWWKNLDDTVAPVIAGLAEDISNFNWFNTDEDLVTKSNYISAYKGALVIRHSIPDTTSCGIAGIIFLNNNVSEKPIDKRIETVRHEYGHIVQERILGRAKYFKYIAIPSLAFNFFKGSLISTDDYHEYYYSMPWERSAEDFGEVDPGTNYYSPGSDIISILYLMYAFFEQF